MSRQWQERIAQIPWEQLEHALGSGVSTADDLLALVDPQEAEVAFEQLAITMVRGDEIFPAALPAMEILAEMLACRAIAPELGFPLLSDFARCVALLPPKHPQRRQARACLSRIQAQVLPLVHESPQEALPAIGLQGVLGEMSAEVETALGACLGRDYPVALAAVRALARAGMRPGSMPADWRFAAVGAWTRLLGGDQQEADIDVLARHWYDLGEVVDVGSELPWEQLTSRNPSGALELYRRVGGEAGARGLVEVIECSRGLSQPAQEELLALLGRGEVPAATAVALLMQLPPSREVCDSLDAVAGRVPRPRGDTDVLADLAAVLASAGDRRWESHLATVLETNPRAMHVLVATPSSLARLGYAFGRAPVAGSRGLALTVGELLAEEARYRPSEAVEALLWWLAHWGSDAAQAARPGVLNWLEQMPRAVAPVLATWGNPEDAELLRAFAPDGQVLLAIAKLSGQAADWRALLAADLPYLEAEVLQCYPQPTDPVFLDWATKLIAAGHRASAEARVLAMERLAAGRRCPPEQLWPGLLEIVAAGGRPMVRAIEAAGAWAAQGAISEPQKTSLEELLRGLVGQERSWPAARALAAAASIELLGRWIGSEQLLVEILERALSTTGEHGEVIRLLQALVLAGDPVARAAVLGPVRRVLDTDRRLDFHVAKVVRDEAEFAQLHALLRSLAQ